MNADTLIQNWFKFVFTQSWWVLPSTDPHPSFLSAILLHCYTASAILLQTLLLHILISLLWASFISSTTVSLSVQHLLELSEHGVLFGLVFFSGVLHWFCVLSGVLFGVLFGVLSDALSGVWCTV